MGLDRNARKGVWRVEGEVHKKTGISSTELRFKKMRMEIDILDYAIRGVLSMECEDGK